MFVFIWFISLSIVPFRSIHAVPSPRNSFLPAFIYVFGHAGSLLLCMGIPLGSVNGGYSAVVCGLLVAVASLAAEHRL